MKSAFVTVAVALTLLLILSVPVTAYYTDADDGGFEIRPKNTSITAPACAVYWVASGSYPRVNSYDTSRGIYPAHSGQWWNYGQARKTFDMSTWNNISFYASGVTGTGTVYADCRMIASSTVIASIGSTAIPTSNSWQKVTYTIPSACKASPYDLYFSWTGENGGIDDFAVNGIYYNTSSPPTSSFTVNITTGTAYPPVSVLFADSSTNNPTTFNWSVDGTIVSTERNYTFTTSVGGSWLIKHGVANTDGSSTSQTTYVVNNYSVPTCSYTYTPNNGTSPLGVSFTDTSTGNPTSYFWNFNPLNDGWLTPLPQTTNTTANPKVVFLGSGVFYILHTVTNPAGTSTCPTYYINMSGNSPEPTPTATIPFPNQTGICRGSDVSFGSNTIGSTDRYWHLQTPTITYQGYLPRNETRISTGNLYTQELGQYIYQEFEANTALLVYQSSYVTRDCEPVVVTPTTFIPITNYPTPAPIHTYPTFNPTSTITMNPTVTVTPPFNYSTIPTFQPTYSINNSVNITNYRETLIEWSPLLEFFLNIFDGFIYDLNRILLQLLVIALMPIVEITAYGNYALGLSYGILHMFVNPISLITAVMNKVITAIPVKVQNLITLLLCWDIIVQIYTLKSGRL